MKNIDTNQIARFNIENHTEKSAFNIYILNDKHFIAPGLSAQLVINYNCKNYQETEEIILVTVKNGKTVLITVIVSRDQPILKGLEPIC